MEGPRTWWGPPAGTNGPGRLDERGYAQNASFMTHPGPASYQFTIGSAVLRKITKKTQPVNFTDMSPSGGADLNIHVRHSDVCVTTQAESARRAEVDKRAEYDRRVEIATSPEEKNTTEEWNML